MKACGKINVTYLRENKTENYVLLVKEAFEAEGGRVIIFCETEAESEAEADSEAEEKGLQ